MNPYMASEIAEDAVAYAFVDEFDEDGFPFLSLYIDCGYSGGAPTCIKAWAKMRDDGNPNPTALTRGQRRRLRARKEPIAMGGLEEGEEESGEDSGLEDGSDSGSEVRDGEAGEEDEVMEDGEMDEIMEDGEVDEEAEQSGHGYD